MMSAFDGVSLAGIAGGLVGMPEFDFCFPVAFEDDDDGETGFPGEDFSGVGDGGAGVGAGVGAAVGVGAGAAGPPPASCG